MSDQSELPKPELPDLVPLDPPVAGPEGWQTLAKQGDYSDTDMLALPGYGYLIRSMITPHGASQEIKLMALVFVPEVLEPAPEPPPEF